MVIVVKEDDYGDLYGQLICHPNDSCSRVPYALNNGKGYTKILNQIQ